MPMSTDRARTLLPEVRNPDRPHVVLMSNPTGSWDVLWWDHSIDYAHDRRATVSRAGVPLGAVLALLLSQGARTGTIGPESHPPVAEELPLDVTDVDD